MSAIAGKYRGTVFYGRVLAELIRAAEYRGVTTYQDIAVLMELPQGGSHMGREIGRVLGEVSEDEVLAGRPMLSAVAVGVDGRPGAGFYACAREIGKYKAQEDDPSFWKSERELVYKAWRRPLPKSKEQGA